MRLDYPDKHGVSKREHLEQIAESTGKEPKELEMPPFPELYDELWDLFWEIRIGEPLTYQELSAYQQLSGETLTPWEIEQLRFMDAVVRDEISRLERKPRGQKDIGDRNNNGGSRPV